MKKVTLLTLLFVLLSVSAVSESRRFGIETGLSFSSAPLYVNNTWNGDKYKFFTSDHNYILTYKTYDFFLKENTWGLYAGYDFIFMCNARDGYLKINDSVSQTKKVSLNHGGGLWGIGNSHAFVLGPAWRYDFGISAFQVGMGLHGITRNEVWTVEYLDGRENQVEAKGLLAGIAVSPQFKFNSDRLLNFSFGTDMVWDFMNFMKMSPKYGKGAEFGPYERMKVKFLSRFELRPYICMGFSI